MNLLICGDSFAANYQMVHPLANGWVNMLSKKHNIVNLAQCGVSEYKIWKQVKSANIESHDAIIVCHTSPSRVHIKTHPVHKAGTLHDNCDLILQDLEHNNKNIITQTGIDYFKFIYDHEYYSDVYSLIKKDIIDHCHCRPTIHISFFEDVVDVNFNFNYIFKNHRGDINHLTETGNAHVFDAVDSILINSNYIRSYNDRKN
jgi:hypothetical protein